MPSHRAALLLPGDVAVAVRPAWGVASLSLPLFPHLLSLSLTLSPKTPSPRTEPTSLTLSAASLFKSGSVAAESTTPLHSTHSPHAAAEQQQHSSGLDGPKTTSLPRTDQRRRFLPLVPTTASTQCHCRLPCFSDEQQ